MWAPCSVTKWEVGPQLSKQQFCPGSIANQRRPKLSPVNPTAEPFLHSNQKRISSANRKSNNVPKPLFKLKPFSLLQSNITHQQNSIEQSGAEYTPLSHATCNWKRSGRMRPKLYGVCKIHPKCSEIPCESSCHKAFQSTPSNAFDKSRLIIQMGVLVDSVLSTTCVAVTKCSSRRRTEAKPCCSSRSSSVLSMWPNIKAKHVWNNLKLAIRQLLCFFANMVK